MNTFKIEENIETIKKLQQKMRHIETSVLWNFLDEDGSAPEELEETLMSIQKSNFLLADYEQKLHNKLKKVKVF